MKPEHLEIARELGNFRNENNAGWHYYMARYHQSGLSLTRPLSPFALPSMLPLKKTNGSKTPSFALDNARTMPTSNCRPIDSKGLETLVSHSDDYFRLYEMPVSEGRLLVIPEQLQTKEDKRRAYTAQLHWLPGHRFAFYSSYGKDGDTGLDIYRVAVNGVGEYGEPEKLPAPVNSDFDDCAPICLPASDEQALGELFQQFAASVFGGFDIFKVEGALVAEGIQLAQSEDAVQLPFEINSTADEFLYWENRKSSEAWLTTNRNQDFEGAKCGDLILFASNPPLWPFHLRPLKK